MIFKFLATNRRSIFNSNNILELILNDLNSKYIHNTIIVDDDIVEGNFEFNNNKYFVKVVYVEYKGKDHLLIELSLAKTNDDFEHFEIKNQLLEILKQYYKGLIIQRDDHNIELCKKLYARIHNIENSMRNIVNSVMTHEYGINWYEDRVKTEGHRTAINPNNDWYSANYTLDPSIKKAVYNLYFKEVIDIITDNTESSCTFELYNDIIRLKHLTDKFDATIIGTISKPRSFWEQHFQKMFSSNFIDKWDKLNSIRNVIAHNKLLVPTFIEDTIKLLDDVEEELSKIQVLVKKKFDDNHNRMMEMLEALYEIEYEELLFESAGISKYDEDSAIEYIANCVEYTSFENILEAFTDTAKQIIDDIEDGEIDFNIEPLDNDYDVFKYSDFTGNEIEICVKPLDFEYERGGSCDIKVELRHKYDPEFEKYFSPSKQSFYTVEDFPRRISHCTKESGIIRIFDYITLNFGDFEEIDGQVYPSQNDEVLFNKEFFEVYLNEYLTFLSSFKSVV